MRCNTSSCCRLVPHACLTAGCHTANKEDHADSALHQADLLREPNTLEELVLDNNQASMKHPCGHRAHQAAAPLPRGVTGVGCGVQILSQGGRALARALRDSPALTSLQLCACRRLCLARRKPCHHACIV